MLEVDGSLPLDLPSIIPGCGFDVVVVEKRVVGLDRVRGRLAANECPIVGGKRGLAAGTRQA